VKKRPFRSLALVLVAASAVPLLIFTALVVVRLVDDERAAGERRLVEFAQTQSHIVDRELTASVRTLTALAESERLDRDDVEGFHRDARRVVGRQPAWYSIVLLTPDGTQLVNSAREPGAPAWRALDPQSLADVRRTMSPSIGSVSADPEGRLGFPVRVPVIRDGKLEYVLTATVTSDALGEVISRQLPADAWIRTLIDARGIVVAATSGPSSLVGRRAPPAVLAHIATAAEGVFRDNSLGDRPMYVAFSHGPGYGWTSLIGMPAAALDGPVHANIAALAAFSIVALSLTGLGAFLFAGRVSQDLRATAAAAGMLARGEQPATPDSVVAEVEQVGAAIERSAALLTERRLERDQHLARAEQARAAAEAADRAKDEFLAMLGHELRNPLSPIVTAIELWRLRHDPPGREMEVIARQTKQLTRLVDDLLDASRITRGKIALTREFVALRDIVEQAIEMTASLYAERRHHLTVEVSPENCSVIGDRARLAQVIANLLVNAGKYTPPAGSVRVSVRQEQDAVVLTVSDNGQGLTPDLLPRVFDLFVQGPRSSDRQDGGMGIGLTLVQQLVQLHGGTVAAASDGAGRGSTFTVRLPAAAQPEAIAHSTPTHMPSPGLSAPASLRLLVVDDNQDAADLLAALLREHGHEVATAYDSAAALQTARAFVPTVAFLDVGLPAMDGYELARRIRQELRSAAPAFVAVTGYGHARDRSRSEHEGFAAHLVKPVEPAAIAEVLSSIGRDVFSA